jgi:uncharacterized membrane protein YbhN (UPF0104 family)
VSSPLAGRIVRALVAVGLTAYLVLDSEPAEVASAAARAEWRWLLFAILLVVADRALMAWRWIALLEHTEESPRPPVGRLLHIFFVSTFLGTWLPSSVGSDVLRTWSLSREQVSGARAAASVAMDRLLGVVALVMLAAVGLFRGRHLLPEPVLVLGLGSAALGCLAGLVVVYSHAAERLLLGLAGRLPDALATPASRLVTAVRAYASRHGIVTMVLIASLAVNVLRVLQAWALGVAIGMDLPLGVYFAFVPMIIIAMLLPISIYGLGVSQAGFVWFFDHVGVPAPESLALSFLFLGLGLLGNLPGAALYVVDRGQPPSPRVVRG